MAAATDLTKQSFGDKYVPKLELGNEGLGGGERSVGSSASK
jgi:hypothetical protein